MASFLMTTLPLVAQHTLASTSKFDAAAAAVAQGLASGSHRPVRAAAAVPLEMQPLFPLHQPVR